MRDTTTSHTGGVRPVARGSQSRGATGERMDSAGAVRLDRSVTGFSAVASSVSRLPRHAQAGVRCPDNDACLSPREFDRWGILR